MLANVEKFVKTITVVFLFLSIAAVACEQEEADNYETAAHILPDFGLIDHGHMSVDEWHESIPDRMRRAVQASVMPLVEGTVEEAIGHGGPLSATARGCTHRPPMPRLCETHQ